MSDDYKEATDNLQKFLEEHGTGGFLKLFYTNYLFDLITYYIQTKGTTKEDDPGYLYHFNIEGKPFSPEQIDKFNEKLKKICLEYATKIVDSLKSQTNLDELVSKPLDTDSRTLLDNAFEKIIKGFEEK